MIRYKIVASDLDGTLLDDNSEISLENMNAITELYEKGVFFVPSSGRSFSEMPDEIKTSKYIRYLIASNGAVVFDKLTNDNIMMCMEKDFLKGILDILYSYRTHLTYRYNGNCYVDKEYYNEASYKYYNVWECHIRVITEFGIPTENFKEELYSLDNIEVISIFFHSEKERLECKKRLLEHGGLQVVEACENNLEIMSDKAGKGNALHKLCDKLGIDYNCTIAVGDSDNDASIVKAAGLGLAVENARQSLKNVADAVACRNTENVVDYILKKYIEC